MYFVYILRDKFKKNYIGYTEDIDRRFLEHKRGKVKTTKNMVDIQLYYYEAYPNLEMAQEREQRLKQFGSSYSGLMKRIGLK